MKKVRIDFLEREKLDAPRISNFVRRKKIPGASFENLSNASFKRKNVSANVLFARHAISAKWNSKNEWD